LNSFLFLSLYLISICCILQFLPSPKFTTFKCRNEEQFFEQKSRSVNSSNRLNKWPTRWSFHDHHKHKRCSNHQITKKCHKPVSPCPPKGGTRPKNAKLSRWSVAMLHCLESKRAALIPSSPLKSELPFTLQSFLAWQRIGNSLPFVF